MATKKPKHFVWPFALALVVALCIPAAHARKPKPRIQLYGESLEGDITDEKHPVEWHTAFLILPDGSHALALCSASIGITPSCIVEPFAAEKRVTVPCDLLKESQAKGVTCYKSEWYESERKNNDITLFTAQGKVTYHITGSW